MAAKKKSARPAKSRTRPPRRKVEDPQQAVAQSIEQLNVAVIEMTTELQAWREKLPGMVQEIALAINNLGALEAD